MANENRDFFVSRMETEIPAFVRVLKALPEDKLEYKPHEKCTAAGKLAWQLANEMAGLVELFETGDVNYGPAACPSRDEIVSTFEKNAKEAVERAKSASEDRWTGPGRFLAGGQVVWPDKVMNIAWEFLFDMVHHRGQLSSYLRPMGAKVPKIYGPSGDS